MVGGALWMVDGGRSAEVGRAGWAGHDHNEGKRKRNEEALSIGNINQLPATSSVFCALPQRVLRPPGGADQHRCTMDSNSSTRKPQLAVAVQTTAANRPGGLRPGRPLTFPILKLRRARLTCASHTQPCQGRHQHGASK